MNKLIKVLFCLVFLFGMVSCAKQEEPEVMNAEKVRQIISAKEKWTFTNPDGVEASMTFFDDGKLILVTAGMSFDDAEYTIGEKDLIINTSFMYGTTKYAASYTLVENEGSYQLQNVKHPEDLWDPVG